MDRTRRPATRDPSGPSRDACPCPARSRSSARERCGTWPRRARRRGAIGTPRSGGRADRTGRGDVVRRPGRSRSACPSVRRWPADLASRAPERALRCARGRARRCPDARATTEDARRGSRPCRDDTIRRVRALLVSLLLVLAACTPTAVRIPREPFTDIPVPAGWVPYSRESVITETPTVTTAKLFYFSQTSVDASLQEARR